MGYAILYASDCRNVCPVVIDRDNIITPDLIFYGSLPELSRFHTFLCQAWAHVPSEIRDKFEDRAVECRFIGFPSGPRDSSKYLLEQVHGGKMFESNKVRFNEQVFPSLEEDDDRGKTGDDLRTQAPKAQRIIPAPVFDRELRKNPKRFKLGDDFVASLADSIDRAVFYYGDDKEYGYATNYSQDSEDLKNPFYTPKNIQLASECAKAKEWLEASSSELKGLVVDRGVYYPIMYDRNGDPVVDLSVRGNAKSLRDYPMIKQIWVYKIKIDAFLNSVSRYKARLCAQGFTQTYGRNFFDTYAGVAVQNNIRAQIAKAVALGYSFVKIDVTQAFLRAKLKEWNVVAILLQCLDWTLERLMT
jgi:hypothetical protein